MTIEAYLLPHPLNTQKRDALDDLSRQVVKKKQGELVTYPPATSKRGDVHVLFAHGVYPDGTEISGDHFIGIATDGTGAYMKADIQDPSLDPNRLHSHSVFADLNAENPYYPIYTRDNHNREYSLKAVLHYVQDRKPANKKHR